MNYLNGKCFLNIRQAGESFLQAVNGALRTYRAEKQKVVERSRQFKNEDEYIANCLPELKEKALGSIRTAQKEFSRAIRGELPILRGQLERFLDEPVPVEALSRIRTASEFDVPLSKSEIESYLRVNGGSLMGLRVLKAVLERTGSKYAVTFRDIDKYEADLSELVRLAANPVGYDTELHPEAVEVLRDEPETATRPDGTVYLTGSRYTGTGLLISRGGFEVAMDRLEQMAEVWSADISTPEITTASAEMRREQEEENRRLQEQGVNVRIEQGVPSEGVSSVALDDAGNIQLAKQLGRERAQRQKSLLEELRGVLA